MPPVPIAVYFTIIIKNNHQAYALNRVGFFYVPRGTIKKSAFFMKKFCFLINHVVSLLQRAGGEKLNAFLGFSVVRFHAPPQKAKPKHL